MAASTPGSSRMCSSPAAAIATNQTTMTGREEARHPRGAAALRGEQRDQDDDGERHDVVVEGGRDQLQAFDRRQHGNRRRDDGVAQKHGGADDAEQEHERGAPPERARRQRGRATACRPRRCCRPAAAGRTYLSVTTMISDHRISESTPSTTSRVTGPDSVAATTATRNA